ncbi:MAG: hypothetical protein KDE48_21745 [Anaerolineales bacterium]|nr:hypothetical protein [Anaerolineales bacterium]
MQTSFIGVLVVTIVFIVAILVIIPAWLKHLAQRNIQRRRQIVAQLRMLDPALTTAVYNLNRFSQTQSTRYRQQRSQAETNLQAAQTKRESIGEKLKTLQFVQLPDAGWPISFLLTYPEHFVTIPSTRLELRRCERLLSSATEDLQKTQTALQALDLLPINLQQLYQQLKDRLNAIRLELATERKAGITQLADLESRWQQQQQALAELVEQVTQAESAPDRNDALAAELERVERQMQVLADDVKTLQTERLACDQKLNLARSAFQQIPINTQPTAVSPDLKQAIEAIQTWLQTAVSARQQREFVKVTALSNLCLQLVPLVTSLDVIQKSLFTLRSSQEETLRGTEIAKMDQQYQLIMTDLNMQLERTGTDVAYVPQLATAVASYQIQVQQLQKELDQSQKHIQSDQQQWLREAQKADKKLNQTWQNLQKVCTLAQDDAWFLAYAGLQQQFAAIQTNTTALKEYVEDAAKLAEQIDELRQALVEEFRLLRNYLKEVPGLVSIGSNLAGDWHCLLSQVKRLEQLTTAVQEKGTLTLQANHINIVDAALEDISQLQIQIQQLLDYLRVESEQMQQRVDNISYATQTVIDPQGNVPPEYQSNMDLIGRYYQHAMNSDNCNETNDALVKAENLANQMILP